MKEILSILNGHQVAVFQNAILVLTVFLAQSAVMAAPGKKDILVHQKQYQSYLSQSEKVIRKQFQTLQAEVETASKEIYKISIISRKANRIRSELSGDKKISNERRVILRRDLDRLTVERDRVWQSAIGRYGFAFGDGRAGDVLSGNIEMDEKGIEKLLRSNTYEKSKISEDEPIEISCLRERVIESEPCLEGALRFCSQRFSSSGGKLSYSFLDKNIEIETTTLPNPKEALSYIKNYEGSNGVNKDFIDLHAQLTVGACGYLAAKGYEYSESSLYFKNYEIPKWVYNLLDGNVRSLKDFMLVCAQATKARIDRLQFYERSNLMSEDSKKMIVATSLAYKEKCSSFIQESCANYEPLGGRAVAYHYVTSMCEVRAVTREDVEEDIRRLGVAKVSNADRERHKLLIDGISDCEFLRAGGYSWIFKEPVVGPCKADNE